MLGKLELCDACGKEYTEMEGEWVTTRSTLYDPPDCVWVCYYCLHLEEEYDDGDYYEEDYWDLKGWVHD